MLKRHDRHDLNIAYTCTVKGCNNTKGKASSSDAKDFWEMTKKVWLDKPSTVYKKRKIESFN